MFRNQWLCLLLVYGFATAARAHDNAFDDPILATAKANGSELVITQKRIVTITETRTMRVPDEVTNERYKLTPHGPELISVTTTQEREVEYEIKRYVYELVTRVVDISDVDAFEATGKDLTDDQLRQKLTEETPVVLSRDGNVIDPKFLSILNPDTILLVVTQPQQNHQEEPPPLAPPVPDPGD